MSKRGVKFKSVNDLPARYQEQARNALGLNTPISQKSTPHSQPLKSQKPIEKNEMNKTEAEFFRMLQSRGYRRIHSQDINLRVGIGKCFYRPDFFVEDNMTMYEVKGGFIYDDARVKLRAAAMQYPCFRWVMAQKIKGAWTETVIWDPKQSVS